MPLEQLRPPTPGHWGALCMWSLTTSLACGCAFDPGGVVPAQGDAAVPMDVARRDAGDWDALTVDWCDRDDDGFRAEACGGTDCDDHDPNRWPENPELCDGKDNNCDGNIDEGLLGSADADGDGYSLCQGDCNDEDPGMYPYAPEVCDGKDNDCDGDIDGDADCDGDGYSTQNGDCDDDDYEVYPYAPELCDGKDNDCDGNSDGDADCDGDGISVEDGDCDDEDPEVYPFAPELCDGKDNDCNEIIDEGCN